MFCYAIWNMYNFSCKNNRSNGLKYIIFTLNIFAIYRQKVVKSALSLRLIKISLIIDQVLCLC